MHPHGVDADSISHGRKGNKRRKGVAHGVQMYTLKLPNQLEMKMEQVSYPILGVTLTLVFIAGMLGGVALYKFWFGL